jgi:hypothetical protein
LQGYNWKPEVETIEVRFPEFADPAELADALDHAIQHNDLSRASVFGINQYGRDQRVTFGKNPLVLEELEFADVMADFDVDAADLDRSIKAIALSRLPILQRLKEGSDSAVHRGKLSPIQKEESGRGILFQPEKYEHGSSGMHSTGFFGAAAQFSLGFVCHPIASQAHARFIPSSRTSSGQGHRLRLKRPAPNASRRCPPFKSSTAFFCEGSQIL